MVKKNCTQAISLRLETFFLKNHREGDTTHFSNVPVKNYELSGLAPKDFQELMMGSYFFVEK